MSSDGHPDEHDLNNLYQFVGVLIIYSRCFFHLFLNQQYLAVQCNLRFRDSSRLQTMPKDQYIYIISIYTYYIVRYIL